MGQPRRATPRPAWWHRPATTGAPTRRRCAPIDEHVDELVTHLRFPLEHRKRTRSTNLLEHTLVEVRRRTKIIGRFPGETSALSLIWAVLELASRGWRGITMTPKAVAQIERLRRSRSSAQPPAAPEEVIAA
jgi:transposase-like protein